MEPSLNLKFIFQTEQAEWRLLALRRDVDLFLDDDYQT